ncbi:Protein of unknown function [Terribacillus aidingensis]|uniref:DUF1648 domain-containing protein n=1 Tax=Terribacillus aidingensis TaxID=586416 RepID=A0A285NS69_9BACI|nr:DUF1648 domain-containing protein [Terribacillus aidingensis]SNZ11763.1 Protein of unknown function [Terribacillus aidingensis]
MQKQLHLPKTRSEKVWDTIGISSWLTTVLFLIIIWQHLPEQTPLHMGITGKADDWAAKESLLLLPALSVINFFLLHLLEKNPHLHNQPERLNEQNAAAFYLLSRKTLNKLKNLGVLLLSSIAAEFSMVALGWINHGSTWLMIIALLIYLYPIIEVIWKQRKIK